MKSNTNIEYRYFDLGSIEYVSKSQLMVKKSSKQQNEQNDQNEITKYPQIEPITLITLNSNIVHYKIGSLNQLDEKRKKYEFQSSPTMSQVEYKQKKLITKRSISKKIYIETTSKKQKEFILLIVCCLIILCCVTFLVSQFRHTYQLEIKGLF